MVFRSSLLSASKRVSMAVASSVSSMLCVSEWQSARVAMGHDTLDSPFGVAVDIDSTSLAIRFLF